MAQGLHVIAFACVAALAPLSPAAATCRAAGSTIVSPTQDPCLGVGQRHVEGSRPLAIRANAARKPKPSNTDTADDGEDDDVAATLPLANGVDMSGRLGSLRAGDVSGVSLDDGWKKRPSTLPRTRLTSENGLRIAGPQALKKRAGDGASIGVTFDLPQ